MTAAICERLPSTPSSWAVASVVRSNSDGRHLRAAAVYTCSFTKHETTEVRGPAEMRGLLDGAIEAGVARRLRPFMQAFRETFGGMTPQDIHARRFEEQRGGL